MDIDITTSLMLEKLKSKQEAREFDVWFIWAKLQRLRLFTKYSGEDAIPRVKSNSSGI